MPIPKVIFFGHIPKQVWRAHLFEVAQLAKPKLACEVQEAAPFLP